MRLFRHWKVTTCPLRLHLEKVEESQENATKSLSGKKGTYCIFSCSLFPHPPPPLGKSLVHKSAPTTSFPLTLFSHSSGIWGKKRLIDKR